MKCTPFHPARGSRRLPDKTIYEALLPLRARDRRPRIVLPSKSLVARQPYLRYSGDGIVVRGIESQDYLRIRPIFFFNFLFVICRILRRPESFIFIPTRQQTHRILPFPQKK